MQPIIMLLCLLLFVSSVQAETVQLKSGDLITGEITERTDKLIRIKVNDIRISYYADEIALVNGRPFADIPSAAPTLPPDIALPVSQAALPGQATTPEQSPAKAALRVLDIEVEDKRSLKGHFTECNLKLTLQGDVLENATIISSRVKRAIDDTGRDLQDGDGLQIVRSPDFIKPGYKEEGKAELEIELKSPVRRATEIRNFEADLVLFAPQNDPAAIFKLSDINKKLGQKIRIEGTENFCTFYDKATYDKLAPQKEAINLPDGADKIPDGMKEMVTEMANMFGGMMGSSSIEENSIAVRFERPANEKTSRVVRVLFTDGNGKTIESPGHTSFGSPDGKDIFIYHFRKPVPAELSAVIHIQTEQSLINTSLTIPAIALP